MKLLFQTLIKFIAGIVLVLILVFLPAGTFGFFRGWLFIAVMFIPVLIAGIVMMIFKPELLKKRLNAKESEKEQNLVVKLSGLMFVAGFVVAGLDFRFSWFVLPEIVSYVASAIFLLSYLIYAEVLRENEYLSRTVEVQENQKVICSGLYGVVRHPMYFATILMFLSVPLILGSLISFVVFLVYPFIISVRIKNEEFVLENELEGYTEYKQKVRYRLIPFVW